MISEEWNHWTNGGDQSFRDTTRKGLRITGTKDRNHLEGVDDARHRAQQPHERSRGGNDGHQRQESLRFSLVSRTDSYMISSTSSFGWSMCSMPSASMPSGAADTAGLGRAVSESFARPRHRDA